MRHCRLCDLSLMTFVAYDVFRNAHGTTTNPIRDTHKKHYKRQTSQATNAALILVSPRSSECGFSNPFGSDLDSNVVAIGLKRFIKGTGCKQIKNEKSAPAPDKKPDPGSATQIPVATFCDTTKFKCLAVMRVMRHDHLSSGAMMDTRGQCCGSGWIRNFCLDPELYFRIRIKLKSESPDK